MASWLDRNYRSLMLGFMAVELLLLIWIAIVETLQ